MRMTIDIDEELLQQARGLTEIEERTALVQRGLEALITLENARRLVRFGGSKPDLVPVPRHR